MEELLQPFTLSMGQLVAPLIAIIVAFFGYWIHERMRLQQYLSELRTWSSTCLDALSQAVHMCELDPVQASEPSFFNRRHNSLVHLSSLIDQGRWFFPNAEPIDLDNSNPETDLSSKQRPLDDLVYAYSAVKKMSYKSRDDNTALKPLLVEIKRDFTSSVQTLLDPRKAHKQFGIVMQKKDHFR